MQVSCRCRGGGGPETAEFNHLKHAGNQLSLRLVADAYCLLEVYTVLKNNPAQFGLPEDLQSISPRQSEKSKDKKPKEPKSDQVKQPRRTEVNGQAAPSGRECVDLRDIKTDAFMAPSSVLESAVSPLAGGPEVRFFFPLSHVLFVIFRLGFSRIA